MRILTLVALTIGLAGSTFATHFMGVDITYECIDPCTYRIFHKAYYDCSGGATVLPPGQTQQPSLTFTGNPLGCATIPNQIGNWVFVHNMEVTPVCPAWQAQTACNGGNLLNGVTEGYWYADYDFCTAGFPACSTFNINWSSCCRNAAVSSGAGNQGIFTGSTVIDPSLLPCNNSPTFVNPPVPYICAGQPFTFNQGAFDADGDSLSYDLVACLQGANNPVTYNFGYSPTSPLGASWTVTINPITGDVSLIPNPTGLPVVGVLCIEVKEWRNGVQIGSVVRDIQITVISLGCTGANPTTGGIQNATINGLAATPLSFNEINTCVGLPLCFDIPTVNPTATLNYTMSWNQSIPGATFVDSNNPIVSNTFTGSSPTAQFCWTPNQTGTYSFVLTLSDDNCPINGLNQYSMIIYVNNSLEFSYAIGDNPNCNQVDFAVIPDPNADPANLTYSWSGQGGINGSPFNMDSAWTHFYPNPGTFPWSVTIQDQYGCAVTLDGTSDITQGATIDAGPDIVICSGYPIQLGSAPFPGQTYNWSPGTGLNDPNISDPTFTLVNNGTDPDTVALLANADNGSCQTFANVEIVVFPIPAVNIAPASPQICLGDAATITASGGTSYQWSNGETTASITVSPTSNTTYSVVTFENGCISAPVYVTVEVTVPPVANISGDLTVCPGESTTLTASGAGSYVWSNGSTSSTSTFNNVNANTPVTMTPTTLGCVGAPVTAEIITLANPVANFTAPTECEGVVTAFSDLSSLATGSVVQWDWDFKDPTSGLANTSTLANPVHTFTAAGVYIVELTVTGDNGCEASQGQLINVAAIPEVDFTFNQVCAGLSTQFIDNSSIAVGETIVLREWDFGDGSPSVQGTNVAHTYSDYGHFNVTLTATSEIGCESSFTKTVFVYPNPVADFIVLSACQDSLVVAIDSSKLDRTRSFIQSYTWNFDDPTSASNISNLVNPTHVYDNPGIYNISLTISTENGCVGSITKEVGVYTRPTVDFAIDGSCELDLIRFTDLSTVGGPISTPIRSYNWTFGDGGSSDSQNAKNSYKVSGPGVYTVTFEVGTSEYCFAKTSRDLTIHPNPKAFYRVQDECLLDSADFENQSEILSGSMTYEWDFGDNTPGTSLDHPQHLYGAPGDYFVILTAISDEGCTDQRRTELTIHPLPEIPELVDQTVCFGDLATLQVISNPDDEILWFYDLNGEDPFHTGNSYTTPPLPYGATYYIEPVSPRGCVNTRTPINAFVFSAESSQMLMTPEVVDLPLGTVQFSVASTASIVGWNWKFGEGSFSDDAEPVHEYEFPGKYEVTVSMLDVNGCELTLSRVVEVKKLVNISTPTAFSPNGDGINDLFRVGYFNISQFNIQIFNRWGQMVYQSDNPDFEWNGRTVQGNMVHEGVYVYKLRATDFDGNTIEDSRSITVIK